MSELMPDVDFGSDTPTIILKPKPLISLCMIAGAQDETSRARLEKDLPRALESAAPSVDEMVIINTGMGPKALEAAAKHGAKIIDDEWDGDFSRLRNLSLRHARGEWRLILDADEVLDGKLVHNLMAQIEPKFAGISLPLLNVINKNPDASSQLRVLRRSRVYYKGRVHNLPIVDGPIIATTSPRVIHFGYDGTPEELAAKNKRRLDMCKRYVAEDPLDFRAWHYLSQAYRAEKMLPQAMRTGKKALRTWLYGNYRGNRFPLIIAKRQSNPYRNSLRTWPLSSDEKINNLGWAAALYTDVFAPLYLMGKLDEAQKWITQAHLAAPEHPDPLYFAAYIFKACGDWPLASGLAMSTIELLGLARMETHKFRESPIACYGCLEELAVLIAQARQAMNQGQGVAA